MRSFNVTYVYWDAEGNQCYSPDCKTPQAMRDWYMRNKSTMDEYDRRRMEKELRKGETAEPTAKDGETDKPKKGKNGSAKK